MTRKKTQKYTQDEYLKAVIANRGMNIEVLSPYLNITGLMKVKCNNCNSDKPWYCDARHLLVRTSCPHKRKNRKTTEWYQNNLNKIYNGNILAVSEYKDARTKVSHKCINCDCGYSGVWETLPQHHITYQMGCIKRKSGIKALKTKERYLKKIKEWGFGLVDENDYKGCHCGTSRINHRCMRCNNIELRSPRALMQNQIIKYCANCNERRGISFIALRWLEELAVKNKIYIQHARNEGEFRIPGLKGLRADGYCEETNTIYEFYGDIYHGNINVFKPNAKPHPFRDLTTKQLYNNTMKREKLIKSKNYNVVSIWETDYRNKLLDQGFGPRKHTTIIQTKRLIWRKCSDGKFRFIKEYNFDV